MSIVQVVTEKHLFKDAVVLKPQGQYRSVAVIFWPIGDSMPIAYEEDKLDGDFETASRNVVSA